MTADSLPARLVVGPMPCRSGGGRVVALFALLVVGVAQWAALCRAAEPEWRVPAGLERRVPWTNTQLTGRPDPPLPCVARQVFGAVPLKNPLYLIAEPAGVRGSRGGPERWLVVEQKGRVLAFPNTPDVRESSLFIEVPDHETYGLTFHPRYADNGWIYLFCNGPQSDPKQRFNRIVRYRVRDEAPFDCDRDSAQTIIEWESNGHNGGDLAFGPDGMLYISAGDGTTDSDTNLTGQKITDLVSGMIRIDVEHPEPGRQYAIPKDNPFLHIPDARGELWAFGFRNPWRIHFDPAGNLWCGDIGQDQYEMVELVTKGDNYGWSVQEGGNPFYLERQTGPSPIKRAAIVHPHSEARSITGGVTYRGTRLPGLQGAYIYGDYGTGKIWAARAEAGRVTEVREIADTPLQMLGFGLDAAGEIYLVDYGGHAIYTLDPAPPVPATAAPFPQRLSETGLFTNVARHEVAPGVLPYSVNAPLWSDGAHKERYFAIDGPGKIQFSRHGAWKFPEQTVLVKSFALEREVGQPQTRQWVETRLMILQQKEWVGYSYRWNEEQTDAELVEAAGATRDYEISDPAAEGGRRVQTWEYPSRAACMTCHSRAAGYVLGLQTGQLNRVHPYPGGAASQLAVYEHLGLLEHPQPTAEERAKDPEADARWPRFPEPYGSEGTLEQRVRAYLHSNCAHCHVEAGGGNAAMELNWKTSTDKARIVDVPPLHDKFGLSEPRLIAPGAPERSVLLHRLGKRGRGQMPPLASSIVDEQATRLLRQWIEQLEAAGQ
ncbi:MAG: PQQ-dependent sugar dehydrogenase [Planctomycetaceae bacterium]